MELMTISEAARRLGYKSRSQLYRLLNDGYLHEHVHVQQHTGQRLVDIEGLREKLRSDTYTGRPRNLTRIQGERNPCLIQRDIVIR